MLDLARVLRAVVVPLSLVFSGTCLAAAAAPVSEDGPRWACWYNPEALAIRCLLAQAPQAGAVERDAAAEEAYDPRMSELVRTIWGNPERLSGRQISIPLWTPPTEMERVQILAESVMCGTRPACTVSFDANEDGRATLRVATRLFAVPEEEVLAAFVAEGFEAPRVEALPVVAAQPAVPARRRRSS